VVQTLTSQGWVPFESEDTDPRRSLVSTTDGFTTVVSTTGGWADAGEAARHLVLP